MESYWLTVLVTLEQELAVRQLFMKKEWNFKKYQEESFSGYSNMSRSNCSDQGVINDRQNQKANNLYNMDSENEKTIADDTAEDNESSNDEMDKDVIHQLAEIMEDSLRNGPSESYDTHRESTVLNSCTRIEHSTVSMRTTGKSFFNLDGKEESEESLQSYDLSECLVEDSHSDELIPSSSNCLGQINEVLKDRKDSHLCVNKVDDSEKGMNIDDKKIRSIVTGSTSDKNLRKSKKTLSEQSKSKKKNTGLYHCDTCNYTFKLLRAFKNHKKNGQCMFECEYCGKKFTARYYSNYKSHLKYHVNKREYKCHLCDKTYIDAQALKIHIRKHTGERPFVCDVCGKAFYSSSSLTSHKHTSHPGGVFNCDLCSAVLSTLGNLRVHKKVVHSTERPFTCEICGKTFKTQKALEQIHAKVHMEVYPYKCTFAGCDKAFKRAEGLADHNRRHNNQRSHFCERCGKGFYSNKDLQLHARTHSGVKPYSCQLCSYRCALAGNLRKHLKTHQ